MLRQPGDSIFTDRDFTIIDETADWIVLDKPAHLLIHPSRPDGPFTLWHGLRELLAYEIHTGGQISIINRLDRETSGLVLVAKSLETARFLVGKMEARLIKKEYLALVGGWPPADAFQIDAPLLRQGEKIPSLIYLRQMVHPDGVSAVTDFTVLRRFSTPLGSFALILAQPITGRTHQIRVHLAHAGFPLVGDKIYGPDERCYLDFIETGWTPALQRLLLLRRHALHSASLEIAGVGSWRSPLPADLQSFLDQVVHKD